MKFLKKYHKIISLVFSAFIILFSVSGIILNHRDWLAGKDFDREVLPKEYHYRNWNNAAVKSTLVINPDSILIYGNIGVWHTDRYFSEFSDFNAGFPEGIDNRKIERLALSPDGKLLAGTYFGLFEYDEENKKWHKRPLPVHEKRIADISTKGDSTLILTRSHLLISTDLQIFSVQQLPPPENYDNKIGLFKTLWVIHSGEIYGVTGKIIVDILGIILAFLTVSGFILLINRLVLKKKNISKKVRFRNFKTKRFTLRWHNDLGRALIVFLLITSATGIFLRPPFLIPIADKKVSKIPFSELDTDNAWFDQLRRILYDAEDKRFIVATSEGFFYSDDEFESALKKYPYQPPASVMGVNVLKKHDSQIYLIGSFEGLFLWHAPSGRVLDYIQKQPYATPAGKSRPIGQFLVTGYSADFNGREVFFDYNSGAHTLSYGRPFPDMPETIRQQPISLWNVALEVHTGRIFQAAVGDFYIFIVPLTGLSLIFILISGYILWRKLYRKRKRLKKRAA